MLTLLHMCILQKDENLSRFSRLPPPAWEGVYLIAFIFSPGNWGIVTSVSLVYSWNWKNPSLSVLLISWGDLSLPRNKTIQSRTSLGGGGQRGSLPSVCLSGVSPHPPGAITARPSLSMSVSSSYADANSRKGPLRPGYLNSFGFLFLTQWEISVNVLEVWTP